jgi:transposase
LGDRSSYYCVLDETGRKVVGQKVSTTPKTLQAVFGAMPRNRVTLETGMHWPWVGRLLSKLRHEVIVGHARNLRLIGESRRKDDRLDAQRLARLTRIDPQVLCPVKHRSARAQADLTVIRTRAGLLRARTALEECGKKMFEKQCASSSSNQDDPFVPGRQRHFASRAKTGPTIAISKT